MADKMILPTEHRKRRILEIEQDLKNYKNQDGSVLPEYNQAIIQMICQLAAFAVPPQKIANKIGIPGRNVKLILSAVSIKREVYRLQEDLFKESKQVFQQMLPDAVDITYKIMRSPKSKEASRIEAAKMIMDRALGKPVQHIEQSTTLLKDVLQQLNVRNETIEEASIVPEASSPEVKTEASDPLDEILL